MSSYVLESNERLRLQVGPFKEDMQLRDVAITPQKPQDVCLEEVRIDRVAMFRGTAPLEYLPRPKPDLLETKLYLTASIEAGSIVYVTLRSYGEREQYITASVRAGSLGEIKSTVFELEKK